MHPLGIFDQHSRIHVLAQQAHCAQHLFEQHSFLHPLGHSSPALADSLLPQHLHVAKCSLAISPIFPSVPVFPCKSFSVPCAEPSTIDSLVSSLSSTFFSIGTVAFVGAILSPFIWNQSALDKLDGEKA